MKILFFTDNLNAGGKERRLTELLKMISLKKDFYIELVLMNDNIHFEEVLDLGIKVHFILRKTKKDISVFPKLYKICKNLKPDILHCWDSMTAVYSVPICKLLHIKLINGMVTNSPLQKNIFNKHWLRAKLTFPFSDLIVGNSLSGLKAYKAPGKKSQLIHNGFNFNRINNILPKKLIREQLNIGTKHLVGMVASFSKNKDYRTYYTAARFVLMKRQDVIFIAIGRETDSFESIELIDKQYMECFRLIGERSGIESYINAMDICILSTFTEGISNSILEYMALGKPVIATTGGGTREIVIDHKTGFLLNRANPAELAERLEILLNNDDLCVNMGLAGRERIISEFSIEQMVNKYYNLYQQVSRN